VVAISVDHKSEGWNRLGVHYIWTRNMKVRVECYAGYKDSERPMRFRVSDHSYLVSEVLDQWYGPEEVFFKVRADDGNLYILRHFTSVADGEWELVSFRRG
jgi:hypothetical protein